MIKKCLCLLVILLIVANLFGQYNVPNANIKAVYDIERPSYYVFKEYTKQGYEISNDSKISLKELVAKDIELAGRKFSPILNAEKKFYQTNKISKVDFSKKTEIPIDLSKYGSGRTIFYSADHSKGIMTLDYSDGVGFIYIDFEKNKIKEYPNIRLNGAMSEPHVQWLANQKEVLITMIPEGRSNAPDVNSVPQSPTIEETSGKMSQMRTFTNLLKDANDELLFDYYFTSQIAIVNLKSGKINKIGEPGIYSSVSVSPNNKLLLISEVQRPYSYTVAYYYFPMTTEIWDLQGNVIKEVFTRELQDEIPIGGTYAGERYHHWLTSEPQTLVWYEAQDNGDPKIEVAYRDIVYKSPYPFSEKSEFFRTEHRLNSYSCFANKNYIIYGDYDRDRLWVREWLFNLGDYSKVLITDQSVNDKYSDRGEIFTVWNENKDKVIVTNGDLIYYFNHSGASPEGNKPYIASFNLKTLEFIKLFEADSAKYEQIITFADKDFSSLIIGTQDVNTPRNYQIVDLKTKQRTTLTNNTDPYPGYAKLKKELVNYKRSDGVDLSGVLYLPANYEGKEKLPLIIHAYPREYVTAETAGQVSGTDKTFTWFYGDGIKYMAMNGYAVLSNASIPIIGEPDVVNDTFISQLLDGVSSAVNYLEGRGIADPTKVGIIGHSYGAFMVANVLANSDICQVGVAKSGAYNRTLTPFGFQKERRTFWEAKDFYIEVSPFAQADQINEPLLLIHGENDPNSGTYPMQTRRLYQAIKGNGGTARMVILPLEGHGYQAEESELHVLSEIEGWFNKYLKPQETKDENSDES
ncbi:MAG: prolyl oligopeptidase family serine peptidase [Candidatus Cloacimonadales bacterium]